MGKKTKQKPGDKCEKCTVPCNEWVDVKDKTKRYCQGELMKNPNIAAKHTLYPTGKRYKADPPKEPEKEPEKDKTTEPAPSTGTEEVDQNEPNND